MPMAGQKQSHKIEENTKDQVGLGLTDAPPKQAPFLSEPDTAVEPV